MINVFKNQTVYLKRASEPKTLDVKTTYSEKKAGVRGTVSYGGTRAVRFDGSVWYEV